MKEKILLIMFILLSTVAYAQWDDCPYGEVDEPYPGTCPRYIDTNNDSLCDKSQKDPSLTDVNVVEAKHFDLITGKELKTKTVQEVADIYEIDSVLFAQKVSEYIKVEVKTTDSFQILHDNYDAEPNILKDIAIFIKTNNNTDEIINEEKTTIKKEQPYVMLPIVIIATLLYVTTYVLTKKKIMKLKNHLKLWNYLLMVSFLISCGLGILLVISINSGKVFRLPFNMLYWHVEFGIVMTILTMFHILWYSKFRIFIKRFF